ncbi:hypothetical protein LguiA_003867 [Lonicera macranthoides]
MAQPIAVDILSDDDDEHPYNDVSTPLQPQSKRPKSYFNPNPNPTTVFLIDDDPTPLKPPPGPTTSTPSFVAETPMSDFSKSSVSFVKCSSRVTDPRLRVSSTPDPKPFGISGLICLESDNESERGSASKVWKQNESAFVACEVAKDSKLGSRFVDSPFHLGHANMIETFGDGSLHPILSEDDLAEVQDHPDEETDRLQPVGNAVRLNGKSKDKGNNKRNLDDATGKKRLTKEERIRLMEEKKRQKEQEKLQKAALKAEAAEMKKLQKEKQKWEKGKFALKSIVAEIDKKVVELGSVGGHLLTRLAEKGVTYRITSNPIERSIVWTMTVPEQISQFSSGGFEIPYVLIVYEADEFCNLVMDESLMDHTSRIQSRYPSYTVCYLTNRLMAYINKREQGQYKDPASYSGWRRPPVEEMLSKLTTHFFRVHSRQCIDEAELAEHVVGLTCSLASCQFRLKALIAIPKVQPRFALAIWKKYPTMKSLLTVYMDPSKSVHEKEFLLKDLTTEGIVGEDRRLGEVCSKRVYRILMAKHGSIKTDDVEDGADLFSPQSSGKFSSKFI